MILYIVRHGESAYNVEGRIQGQLDVPLSALGCRQAATLVQAFEGVEVDAVFASPLKRAWETAVPVAKSLGLEPRADEGLVEINAGIFQGLTWPEINDRYPAEGVAWKQQLPDFRIPGGESRRDLMQRAEGALGAIRKAGYERVLVVAHGGVLTAGLKALLGVPAERNPFSLFNGSISQADWNAHFKLLTLNQMEHLRVGGEDLRSRGGDL
jgi:broad specificity phosphatase PhoE